MDGITSLEGIPNLLPMDTCIPLLVIPPVIIAWNTQRPEYPTFLLGIPVVGYSRRWVFPPMGVADDGYAVQLPGNIIL